MESAGRSVPAAPKPLYASEMSTLEDAHRALSDTSSPPKVEALIEAMFLAAVADGAISPEESARFSATVAQLTKGNLTEATVQRRVGALTVLLGSEGKKARLAAVKERLAAGVPRETALLLATVITATDGEVVWRENAFLAELAEALEIPPTRAVELVAHVQQAK